ncbi:monovalent cation/H(+) antiporter subunit G [Ectothiorhodospira sp. BSL-9]|uniref:cation:proton antiporter n=1 Tax=Ectothiorhodospira sp. BSL-9 TaxID=1442136 RepID=UPI0007B4278B|nr:monovalent cation/H(+) antiporter subunit G [Ectothiorhodospira sp. BSL-9]ANB02566.1 hypothetical protein ECTOBSL9_1997 [Ectothiorhodospira sp. BSL-9]TVQ74431.1 MAG: monovalent cation/H(+) antiporter subunit G [Chromatiaceae bacterium]
MLLELLAIVLIALGAAFFVVGTIGLLRFPDTLCRLHALTKADGVGLGLTCLGVALLADSAGEVVRILLIGALVAASGAVSGHLTARHVLQSNSPHREAR